MRKLIGHDCEQVNQITVSQRETLTSKGVRLVDILRNRHVRVNYCRGR